MTKQWCHDQEDTLLVHVEKIEHSGDDLPTAGLELSFGPFGALFIDPGGKQFTVTLTDGRVGHGPTREQAIEIAEQKPA